MMLIFIGGLVNFKVREVIVFKDKVLVDFD